MIVCGYCGADNLDNAMTCQGCGSPRLHTAGRTITTSLKELMSSTTDDAWAVRGYDASAWNGSQDGAITKQKTQFAFLRAGYGNGTLDPNLATYQAECAENGIVFGLYWFVYVGLNYTSHANSFYNVWKTNPGKLPPVFDFEHTTLDRAGTINWIYNFVRAFEQLSGKRGIFYTSPGWWNGNTNRSLWVGSYPLWVANWTTAAYPTLPYDWKIWTFWQYSADGNGLATQYGFTNGDKDLDLDRYNGTVDAFNTAYGTSIKPIGETTPPPPVTPPTTVVPLYKGQVTATALNIRATASATSTDIGDLKLGDVVPVTEERDGWCHVEGWVSKTYIRKV